MFESHTEALLSALMITHAKCQHISNETNQIGGAKTGVPQSVVSAYDTLKLVTYHAPESRC